MTAFYLLLNYIFTIFCLGIAGYSAYRIYRHLQSGQGFKPVIVIAYLVIMIAALLIAVNAMVWMPKADNSAPAVNETISRMNQQKLSEENLPAVIPAKDILDNTVREGVRAEEARKVKDAFKALPDAD